MAQKYWGAHHPGENWGLQYLGRKNDEQRGITQQPVRKNLKNAAISHRKRGLIQVHGLARKDGMHPPNSMAQKIGGTIVKHRIWARPVGEKAASRKHAFEPLALKLTTPRQKMNRLYIRNLKANTSSNGPEGQLASQRQIGICTGN